MKLEFKKIYTLSNLISFARILLAIPIFYYISNIDVVPGARYILFSLYVLVYLTDIADGYFARKFNQVSELGKIIDPLADKILVILVVAYLYYYEIIPEYYFWIIILRDLLIFTGGVIVSKKIGKVLPSNYLGKATVLSIGIFIIIVTLGVTNNQVLYRIFLWLSIILSLASVLFYGYRGYKEVKKVGNEIV
jgi:CDP-diacylglycerol--glycerol-3-phosphate 3-phosphatidyltransferase